MASRVSRSRPRVRGRAPRRSGQSDLEAYPQAVNQLPEMLDVLWPGRGSPALAPLRLLIGRPGTTPLPQRALAPACSARRLTVVTWALVGGLGSARLRLLAR